MTFEGSGRRRKEIANGKGFHIGPCQSKALIRDSLPTMLKHLCINDTLVVKGIARYQAFTLVNEMGDGCATCASLPVI